MGGAAVPIATMIGGQLLQGLGNRQGPNTNVAMPPDIRQPRQNQLGSLDFLLGGQRGAQGQGGNPLDRLQSFFGPLDMPQTDLQRQGAGNMTSMLNANAPGSAICDPDLTHLDRLETKTHGGSVFAKAVPATRLSALWAAKSLASNQFLPVLPLPAFALVPAP